MAACTMAHLALTQVPCEKKKKNKKRRKKKREQACCWLVGPCTLGSRPEPAHSSDSSGVYGSHWVSSLASPSVTVCWDRTAEMPLG